jgi:hypothetical protein
MAEKALQGARQAQPPQDALPRMVAFQMEAVAESVFVESAQPYVALFGQAAESVRARPGLLAAAQEEPRASQPAAQPQALLPEAGQQAPLEQREPAQRPAPSQQARVSVLAQQVEQLVELASPQQAEQPGQLA